MSHTKESHVANVNKICRLCLNLVKTQKEARRFKCDYFASDYMLQIYQVYGIDVNSDVPGTHSKFICRKCQKITLVRASNMVTVNYEKEKTEMWRQYDDVSSCKTCDYAKNLFAGRKYKPSTNQSMESTDVSVN